MAALLIIVIFGYDIAKKPFSSSATKEDSIFCTSCAINPN